MAKVPTLFPVVEGENLSPDLADVTISAKREVGGPPKRLEERRGEKEERQQRARLSSSYGRTMMNHMESSRMTTTRVAIAATVVVVLAFAVHDVRAQAVRHASHYEDQNSPAFTGLPGTAFTGIDYNNPVMHRTWEQIYGYMGGRSSRDGLPPPKVSHGTFLADYLDEEQMAEYEEWQKNVDANNTRVLVKVNSQSFDINDELQKLRQVFEISTFADFERYGAKDFELKIRGLRPEFYNTTITELRETVKGNRDRVGSNREHWILDNYFNSWISIENEWGLYVFVL